MIEAETLWVLWAYLLFLETYNKTEILFIHFWWDDNPLGCARWNIALPCVDKTWCSTNGHAISA